MQTQARSVNEATQVSFQVQHERSRVQADCTGARDSFQTEKDTEMFTRVGGKRDLVMMFEAVQEDVKRGQSGAGGNRDMPAKQEV